MVKEKKFFTLMDDYLMIHSEGETRTSNIKIAQTGSYDERRAWVDKVNEVYDTGKDVKDIKIGDLVLLAPHAKPRKMEELTKLMEKFLNKKMTNIKITDIEGKVINGFAEDKEKYFIVKRDEVLCIINK